MLRTPLELLTLGTSVLAPELGGRRARRTDRNVPVKQALRPLRPYSTCNHNASCQDAVSCPLSNG